MSHFVVANGKGEDVRAAFLARPHLVDQAAGFVRLEVLIPDDQPEAFWLMTWWTDEDSFRAWHRSHDYRSAHRFMPKGLKLDPKQTFLRVFSQLCC